MIDYDFGISLIKWNVLGFLVVFIFFFYYLTRQIQNVIIFIFLHQSYEFLSFDSDVI